MRGNVGRGPARTAAAPNHWGRQLPRLAGAIGLAAGLTLASGAAAVAAGASGPGGQSVTVDRAAGLVAAGDSVAVSGAGFDLSKGIYVGVCVNNGPGAVPTPCLGGADTSGGSGSSRWISSNPPSYGQGLAQPFTESGGKGSFNLMLAVAASDALTDCQDPAKAPNGCVIATRADHTRSADRSADVLIPISFGTGAGGGAVADSLTTESDGGAAAGSAPGAAAKSGALAKTGATVTAAAVAGAVLLGGGSFAVIATRRRKTAK
jgi:LPXTG-motif cell wall-anchored protein